MDRHHTQRLQALTRQSGQVGQPFLIALGPKATLGLGIASEECRADLAPYLERTRADARAEPDQDIGGVDRCPMHCIRQRWQLTKLRDCSLQHTQGQSAPPGMCGSYGATGAIGEQD